MSLLVDIKKDFGSFLLDVSFEAGNEVMGLLGASGCGKSMTLRAIAGIITPDEGRIVLDGRTLFDSAKHIDLPPQDRHVGLLFQNYALFPNMNVYQNIRTGLLREHMDKQQMHAAIEKIMDKFMLGGLEKHRPSQLSGGQQQRVALARILVSGPHVLMLDEPFSALDSYLRWEVETKLTDILADFGGTTLIVSHDRDEIYRLCDRVCVVSGGKASPPDTIDEMFDNPRTIAAALLSGCKNISRAKKLGDHELLAEDWGIIFRPERTVPDHIRGLGIRAKNIVLAGEETQSNVILCNIDRRVDEPFYHIHLLTPVDPVCPPTKKIRFDIEKHRGMLPEQMRQVKIRVTEENLMFLF